MKKKGEIESFVSERAKTLTRKEKKRRNREIFSFTRKPPRTKMEKERERRTRQDKKP